MAWSERRAAFCDACQTFGADQLATFSGRVVIGDQTSVWLDLCAQHEAQYLGPAQHAAAIFAGLGGGHECVLCGREYRYRSSLRNHTREKHRTTLAEVERMFGRALPVGAVSHPCEQEGCTYEATAPQGLATHRRAEHGITAEEFWGGDPTRAHRPRRRP